MIKDVCRQIALKNRRSIIRGTMRVMGEWRAEFKTATQESHAVFMKPRKGCEKEVLNHAGRLNEIAYTIQQTVTRRHGWEPSHDEIAQCALALACESMAPEI